MFDGIKYDQFPSKGFEGNVLHHFGLHCVCTSLSLADVRLRSFRCLFRIAVVFFYLATSKHNVEQKQDAREDDDVVIQAISSRELLCQNIIPAFLNLLMASDLRVVKNNDFPFGKSQRGEIMVNILVLAGSGEAAGSDAIAETQPAEPQSRKITSPNNNNRKSNQVTYEM